MLRRIRRFITGHRIVTVPKDEACAAFDLIYRAGLTFTGERRTKDGGIRITMTERDTRDFMHLSSSRDMHVRFSPPHGLFVVLDYIKHRPMIPVGLVLALVWSLYTEKTVWDIRISGNTKTPDSEIIERLDSLGFGVGIFYPSVNFNKLHAEYAASQHDIAWLSVYMDGTVADVQVIEEWHDEREKHAEQVYANVVATREGIVRQVNVTEGEATVKPGETVEPGQVLISGVMRMREENAVRYEYAEGEVICSVVEPINVSSSVKRTEKCFTGHEKTEKSVKIFKKSVNLFVNGGKEVPSCDKIETVKQLSLGGRLKLPVWVTTVTWKEYEMREVTASADEVTAEVLSEVSAKLKALSQKGTMTEKQLTAQYEDGVYSVRGEVTFDEDIGQTVEFNAVK